MNTSFQHTIRVPGGPAITVALKDDVTKTPARNRVAVELFAALLESHLSADGFSAGQVAGHGFWDAAAFFAPVHAHCVESARASVESIVARHMTGKAWVAAETENGTDMPENWTAECIAEFAETVGNAIVASVEIGTGIERRIEEVCRRVDELFREVNRGEEWRNPPTTPQDEQEGGDK
jgi:hypothetical protein